LREQLSFYFLVSIFSSSAFRPLLFFTYLFYNTKDLAEYLADYSVYNSDSCDKTRFPSVQPSPSTSRSTATDYADDEQKKGRKSNGGRISDPKGRKRLSNTVFPLLVADYSSALLLRNPIPPSAAMDSQRQRFKPPSVRERLAVGAAGCAGLGARQVEYVSQMEREPGGGVLEAFASA
jgi:hypothetical protein